MREGTTGCDVGLTEGESRKERLVRSEVGSISEAGPFLVMMWPLGRDAVGEDAVGIPSLRRSCSWTGAPVLKVCTLSPCSAYRQPWSEDFFWSASTSFQDGPGCLYSPGVV